VREPMLQSDDSVNAARRRPSRRQIDDSCAAMLLGFSREAIRQMSQQLGIGRKAADAANDTIVFTYEELQRLCRSSLQAD
jgi:hypothetical protein